MEVGSSETEPQLSDSSNRQPTPSFRLRDWLPTLELLLAVVAGGLWYLQGGWVWYAGTWPGPWPLLLLGLMVVLTLSREGLRAVRITPFTVPLLAFIATAGMAVWVAYSPELALSKMWLLVGALGIYWALAHQPDLPRLYAALACFGLAGAFLSGYFFLTNDWTTEFDKLPAMTHLVRMLHGQLPQLSGRGFHTNATGGMLALLLPLYVPLVMLPVTASGREGRGRGSPVRRLSSLGWILMAGITALGCLLSLSRGAWTAAATSFGLWGLWRVMGAWAPQRARQHRRAVMAALLIAGVGLALLGVWGILRFDLPGAGSLDGRLELYRNALLLARDTPFTGMGLGMFAMNYSIYTLLIHVAHTFHSHNILLDLTLEQGVLGAVAFAMLAATAYGWGSLRLDLRHRKRSTETGKSGQGFGLRTSRVGLIIEAALASLTTLLIHGMMDDVLYGTRGVLLLLVPFGIVAAGNRLLAARRRLRASSSRSGSEPHTSEAPRQRSDAGKARRERQASERTLICTQVALLPLLTVLGIGCILGFRGDSGEKLTIQSWISRWQGAWHANLGVVAQTQTELTVYDPLNFNDPTMDQVRRQESLSDALASFERAVAFDPTNPTARQRQTAIALARGQYDEALDAMQALWDAGFRDRVTRLLYGDALVAVGRVNEAIPIVKGLDFANARLLGQAWARYNRGGDKLREGYANEAAAAVKD
jgi:O-antigen ligase